MDIMSSSTRSNQTLSSDTIHNRNCYLYLLQLKPLINDLLIELMPQLAPLQNMHSTQYDKQTPYGNLYSLVISTLEEIIDQNETLSSVQNKALNNVIKAVYHNNNHILEQEYTGWINDITAQTRPQKTNANSQIKKELKDPPQRINDKSPNDSERIFQRIYSTFSRTFKPQYDTNLPTVKNYSYKSSVDPIEYRFSTQAQRHKGTARVSPLFKRWLKINAANYPEQTISHIYFNNLGYDRNKFNIPGSYEKDLTNVLHELEKDPDHKVLVITLPASGGLMESSAYRTTEDKQLSVFDELLDIAKGKKRLNSVSDFFISPKAKALLFQTPENELEILIQLLTKSFIILGIDSKTSLSTAQKQAVWVHFIKYELTNYIINTLQPQSCNFSCKDSIDRGAVSSTYFNLMKSFETQDAMQKEEFERSLHAAAANVKGRGMNFHRKIIWNALDVYINANYLQLISNPDKAWLIYWRDMNCPHSRVEKLLSIRLEQSYSLLNSLSEDKTKIESLGHQLLDSIQKLSLHHIGGKRLFLEAISRTSELITHPSAESITRYTDLAKEIKVKYPALLIISGIMTMLLGAILYLPSFSYSQKLITDGLSTFKAGFFSQQRTQLCNEMLEFAAQSISVL